MDTMTTFRQLTEIFTPKHYQLTLELDRPGRSFSGVVKLNGTTKSQSEIVLHSKDLVVTKVSINHQSTAYDYSHNDELVITSPLSRGSDAEVTIEFNGTITDAMHGLYPCYYEVDGQKKELLATQFESHHAREVFPCIDEPAGKATFDVTVVTEKDLTVLGNMPIKHQKQVDDQLTTSFVTTPIMSPYLLALVAGDLQRKSLVSPKGVEVNVYATAAHPSENLDFALEVGTKVVDFYSDYFGTDYPLSKCDHVALPDFSSGAMENWGLITYREIALLAGKNTDIQSRRYIATVIAHELAHQWFGNLVTMQWWDDLWLNESFATAMEYISVDKLYPDWNIWRDFSANETVMALRRDSLDGVQSVHVEVDHPDKISTLFDGAIVYAKGARLLRMVQNYVGDENFQAALKNYFKKYAYQNTIGQNLWDELSNVTGEDIGKIMNTWISQPGFPVVSVDKQSDELILSQKQFFIGPHQESQRLWPIPLNSTSAKLPRLLESETQTLPGPSGELRLNHGDSAHFITYYSRELMQELLQQLRHGELDEITRLQLLHEQTLLVKAGLVEAGELLAVLQVYADEDSHSVWDIISIAISEIRQIIDGDEKLEAILKDFVSKLTQKLYQKLGWHKQPGEPEDQTTLRSTILGLVLYSEDSQAIETAHQLYTSSSLEQLDPELRSLIIANEIKHYDQAGQVSNQLLGIYSCTSDGDIQGDICSGLTSTKQPEVVAKLLQATTDKNIIRSQDATRWYAYLVRSRYGRAASWQWLQDNWSWVEKNFRGDKSIDYYPRYTANSLNSQQYLQQYRAFFEPLKSDQSLNRAITIGEGEIIGRIEYINRSLPSVKVALENL